MRDSQVSFVRVKDKEAGHEFTVADFAVPVGCDVIDKPAVDQNGDPLPAKPSVSKGAGTPGPKAANEGGSK